MTKDTIAPSRAKLIESTSLMNINSDRLSRVNRIQFPSDRCMQMSRLFSIYEHNRVKRQFFFSLSNARILISRLLRSFSLSVSLYEYYQVGIEALSDAPCYPLLLVKEFLYTATFDF